MRASQSPVLRSVLVTLTVTALAVTTIGAASVASARPTPEKVQLVHVFAATAPERSTVAALGLDTTEHADPSGVGVVLHSRADAARLRAAGFSWRVEDADLAASSRAATRADAEYSASTARSPLPSGRTSYRTLNDYASEMRALEQRYPQTVRLITLKNRTVQGRVVEGIEITHDVRHVSDGKPVFLLMGLHHAREWPSGENAMEYAYDLLQHDGTTSEGGRATRILDGTRTIIVPVVNPDGFVISRRAVDVDYEYKRKNCDLSVFTPSPYRSGTCANNQAGSSRGTDLNRNYPGFWGGGGASTNWSGETYRGDAPGSEPEVDNIRTLVSQRQVTNLISNHTYSNLVLRPPSIAATGLAPDEVLYKALGASMAAHNAYTNQASYQLYDTSGSTEDWSYWNTGGLGFTFEIGDLGFHPTFRTAVVGEYLGRAPAAGAGLGGNRAAYYAMSASTLDAGQHAVIRGTAPAGHTLRITKSFVTPTSPVIRPDGSTGPPIYYADRLRSSLRTTGGAFTWAVNPSTRPLIVGRYGREPAGPTQPSIPVVNPPGIPGERETEEFTFTVEGMPRYDNAAAQVRIQWPDSGVDWDVFVLDEFGDEVASAASLDDPEVAVLVDPVPGTYRVVVENYSGGATSDWTGEVRFLAPNPATYSGVKERWSLTCLDARGTAVATRHVYVERGRTATVGRACETPAKR